MKNKSIYILIVIAAIVVLQGCSSFLDIKSDKSLAVPSTLEDYQSIMNEVDNFLVASEGEAMSCDHHIPDLTFEALSCQTIKDMYCWMDNPQIESCTSSGWNLAYKNIFRANVVVNGVGDFEAVNGKSSSSSNIKGQGFFIRAINYFELSQIWTDTYSGIESRNKLGLPLKYSSDFNESTTRSSLGETFDQILRDLHMAEELLPARQQSIYLPGKVAAWAYLARVYLYMQDYESASLFAKKCIDGGYQLLDYRTVNGSPTFPFKLSDNKEVLYARFINNASTPSSLYTSAVDKELYEMYDHKDYRKSLFFMYMSNRYIFRGDYSGGLSGTFCGPTLAEMYLVRAETLLRLGDYEEAKVYLEEFMSNRTYLVSTYNKENSFQAILNERRKELVYRGIRFGDVRRLNVTGAGISLKRIIREQEYLLLPNDPRATLLIPQLVIEKSAIVQNPR